ncbi:hypothetical protein EV175_000271 [Coemansia sp. RSA 1933]|nr:hypothetical protein EV175_000271 [Coemansia sp. RSA 1933]
MVEPPSPQVESVVGLWRRAFGVGRRAFGVGRRAFGLVLLLCVVFIWVASSFLVSNLFGEQEFNQPFLITYLNTASFSLYLVGTLVSHLCKRRCEKPRPAVQTRRTSDDSHAGDGAEQPLVQETRQQHSSTEQPRNVAHVYPAQGDRLGRRETVRVGVEFCMLWFAANVTQNASLAYTTVASSSILCSTSGLFTLLIGAAAGVERLNATRLCAVLASIAGVYSIVKHGTTEEDRSHGVLVHAWIGDLLALSSAALYGCYTTLLKRRIGDESRLDAPLFFGSVGVANIVLLWPGFPLLHSLGIERFRLPASPRVWGMVAVNALVGTLVSDYLWLQSMLMTSPLVVTLGLSLTIPLSMAGDIVLKGLHVSLPYCVGAALVLAGFVAANL